MFHGWDDIPKLTSMKQIAMEMTCCSSLYPLPRHFLPNYIRRALASRIPFGYPSHSANDNLPNALTQIHKSQVIACLRAQNAMLALDAARAALGGGISVLEVVMSTPGVLEVIEKLILEFPSSVIGVGTVLNVTDARKAIDAGAEFLMSPCTVMEILQEAEAREIVYIPGVMTPTEILCASNAGAKIVKIYPVSVIGCEKYLSTLKKPFPHIPMIASQGITIDSMSKYFDAGASAVVLSDAIFQKDAMQQKDFGAIHRLSKLAILHACQNRNNAY